MGAAEDKEKLRAYHKARYAANRSKRRAQIKAWALANPEKQKKAHADWMLRNPGKNTQYHRKWKYGLSSEDFERIKSSQGGACAICFTSFGSRVPRVDHDHDTGAVRGLLCAGCNTGLGVLERPRIWRLCAEAYIKKHGSK
jgi:hypothetical protein